MGFEPITSSVQKRRSTNWSYKPNGCPPGTELGASYHRRESSMKRRGFRITFRTPRGIRTLATSLRRRQRLCPLSYGSITLRTCFSIHVFSIAYKSRNSKHIAAPLTGVEPALLTHRLEGGCIIHYATEANEGFEPSSRPHWITGVAVPSDVYRPKHDHNFKRTVEFSSCSMHILPYNV